MSLPDDTADDITLTLRFGTELPPADVLIEHIGHHIRQDFKETKLTGISVRNHPFEGPEVFDDVPQNEPYTSPGRAADTSPASEPQSPWPLVDSVIRSLRNRK